MGFSIQVRWHLYIIMMAICVVSVECIKHKGCWYFQWLWFWINFIIAGRCTWMVGYSFPVFVGRNRNKVYWLAARKWGPDEIRYNRMCCYGMAINMEINREMGLHTCRKWLAWLIKKWKGCFCGHFPCHQWGHWSLSEWQFSMTSGSCSGEVPISWCMLSYAFGFPPVEQGWF